MSKSVARKDAGADAYVEKLNVLENILFTVIGGGGGKEGYIDEMSLCCSLSSRDYILTCGLVHFILLKLINYFTRF